MHFPFPLRATVSLTAVVAVRFGVLAPDCGAQVVRGRITAKTSNEAVSGGIVALIDSTGRAAATTMSDEQGAFALEAPAAGRYTLRVERVAFRSTVTPPFTLRVGETADVPIVIAGEGVSLRAVRVTADRRCVVRPQEGLAAAQLWDEARKALSATMLTQMAQASARSRRDPHRFAVRIRRWTSVLDPETLARLRGEEVESEGETVTPFASVDSLLLARDGYRKQEADGGATYYAPDATILLSDLFLDTHCFRVQAPSSDQRSDLIGLAFEPVQRAGATPRDESRVEVRGVLWLDRATAELRYMNYGYTNLRLGVPTDNLVGLVEFRPLPDGRWIVWRWYIRLPQLVRKTGGADPMQAANAGRITLGSIKEEGGEVLEVLPAGARRTTLGVVNGVVHDSTRGAPLAGARVFLSGTSYAAITDADGRYRIDSVRPGAYDVSLLTPRLDSLLLDAPVRHVTVSAAAETNLDFGIPSRSTIVSRLCPDVPSADSSAVLFGTVRDTSGRLASGVEVRAHWQSFAKAGPADAERLLARATVVETQSVAGGRYALCGIPADTRVTLRANRGDGASASATLRLVRGEMRRVDGTLKPR